MEEPGGVQSMGSQRVGHDWATSLFVLLILGPPRMWILVLLMLSLRSLKSYLFLFILFFFSCSVTVISIALSSSSPICSEPDSLLWIPSSVFFHFHYCIFHLWFVVLFSNSLLKRLTSWPSLVVQWLRVHLAVQGTSVQFLVWEDPTCCGATEPVFHNYWTYALEPASCNYWRPWTLGPVLCKKRNYSNEKLKHHN